MTSQPWPDHLLSLAEWDAVPEDRSRRFELVEGVLSVAPRPSPLHQKALASLYAVIQAQLPPGLTTLPEVEVTIDERHPPTVRVPDLIALPTEVARRTTARLAARDVRLAVEVVSPGSGRTDRVTKLSEYADALIPAYWIVDLDPGPRLTAFALQPDGYHPVAGGDGLLHLDAPAPITIDVARLTSWD